MHRHRLWAKAKQIDEVYYRYDYSSRDESNTRAHETKRVTVFRDVTGALSGKWQQG